MFFTQPAVIRASTIHRSPVAGGNFSRQRVLVAIEHRRVTADEIFARTMGRAVLAEVNAIITNNYFGLHQSKTLRTQTLRDANVVMIAIFQETAFAKMGSRYALVGQI